MSILQILFAVLGGVVIGAVVTYVVILITFAKGFLR